MRTTIHQKHLLCGVCGKHAVPSWKPHEIARYDQAKQNIKRVTQQHRSHKSVGFHTWANHIRTPLCGLSSASQPGSAGYHIRSVTTIYLTPKTKSLGRIMVAVLNYLGRISVGRIMVAVLNYLGRISVGRIMVALLNY
jgi:hypothetical protein